IYYRQYLQLMEHWRKVLPNPMHEVFYEDLVANTELNARAMIDYLGLEWEDGVMDRTGSQRSVKTLSQWQVRQPVYQTSRGKWRQYEKHLAPLIEALGPNVAAYEAELEALATRDAAE
ncbi:MAG: sulfotransferase, partial [Nitratireductor sp.]|nr:sulfotransferase [Nitratireductor sp.]